MCVRKSPSLDCMLPHENNLLSLTVGKHVREATPPVPAEGKELVAVLVHEGAILDPDEASRYAAPRDSHLPAGLLRTQHMQFSFTTGLMLMLKKCPVLYIKTA